MLPFYGVFQYEQDPALLNAYRRALDEWWKNIQREACRCGLSSISQAGPKRPWIWPAAVWTLYRMPMDTIEWTVRNSDRQDIVWASGVERSGQRETLTLLPPDERPIMKWNSNPFVLTAAPTVHGEDDGAAFLLRTGWVAITTHPWLSDAGTSGNRVNSSGSLRKN